MDLGELLLGCGIGGIVVALIQALVNRKKLGADTASVLTKAATDLVKPLSDRIHELEIEVGKLRDQVTETVEQLDACKASTRAKDQRILQLGGRP